MSKTPIVHGGGIAQAAALYGGRPEDWLDLSTGINPCPAPLPPIPAAAWHRLPDAHRLQAARAAAARYYRSGDILPLAVPGTQSAIQCLPALVTDRRRVAILGPTYGEYARVCRLAGLAVDAVDRLEDVTPAHGLVVIVNPNNPTGRVFAPDVLLAFIVRQQARGCVVVVDEAFGDTEPGLSLVPEVSRLTHLVVFRSFGKFFGLAGLRLGFVIAAPAVLNKISDALGPWAVSGPALVVAAALLEEDPQSIIEGIAQRKQALDRVLSDAGLAIVGGTSLFALVETAQAAKLQARLCEALILTRAFPYAPRWLRIGLAPDPDNDKRLADALSRARG